MEVSTDLYRVINNGNPTFADGAVWYFSTLNGLIGWLREIDLGRMMK